VTLLLKCYDAATPHSFFTLPFYRPPSKADKTNRAKLRKNGNDWARTTLKRVMSHVYGQVRGWRVFQENGDLPRTRIDPSGLCELDHGAHVQVLLPTPAPEILTMARNFWGTQDLMVTQK